MARLNFFDALKNASGEEEPVEANEAHDYFRLLYHYAVEHAPSHLPKMQNYVALYGFLRTLALIFVCAFWVIVLHGFTHPIQAPFFTTLALVTMALSYVAYAAFVKFYRRFSLEAMMAISVLHPTEGPLGSETSLPCDGE